MPLLLLIAFIGMPLSEIAVFIQAGALIGLWPTVLAVILTAVIGTALLRHQGLSTLKRAQDSLKKGEVPVGALFEGLCLLIASLLLLTPGFITDSIGFVLLIPVLRRFIGGVIVTRLAAHQKNRGGTASFTADFSGSPDPFRGGTDPGGPSESGPVIEGDFTDITPSRTPERDTPPTRRPWHGQK